MAASRIEEARNKRRKMLIGLLFTYFLWASYLTYVRLPIPETSFKDIVDTIYIISLLINFIYNIKIVSIGFDLMSKNKINKAINDELYALNHLKAIKYSFLILVFTQVLIYYALSYYPLTVTNVVSINIFLMLVLPVITELILDRNEKEELINE